MAATGEHNERGNVAYMVLLLVFGLVLGFGLTSLLWSFGYAEGPLNQNLSSVGASGIDNLWLLRAADYSIGMIVAGATIMVLLNATAWKRTGGY